MNSCLITFRSVTVAQRGERVLRNAGLECYLRRTPKWMEEQGCGYSLKVLTGDLHMCKSILDRNQVRYKKIYTPDDGVHDL